MLHNLLRLFAGHRLSATSTGRSRRRRKRLVVEPLERRKLLSVSASAALFDDGGGLGDIGFDGDTEEYAGLGDATPTGDSYMLCANWGGDWSDAEKSPTNSDDDYMCWAAAGSNVLEWTGWGLVNGFSDTDDIFDHHLDHWADAGGWMQWSWNWFFSGYEYGNVDVSGGGNFFPAEDYSDYYHSSSTDSVAMETIDSYLHSGYGVTLGIFGGGAHAITVWGYNYNPSDTDDYYGLWITDSDDYKHQSSPPDSLRYYEVDYSSSRYYLQDYYGSDSWYIGDVQAFDRPPSALTIDADDTGGNGRNNAEDDTFLVEINADDVVEVTIDSTLSRTVPAGTLESITINGSNDDDDMDLSDVDVQFNVFLSAAGGDDTVQGSQCDDSIYTNGGNDCVQGNGGDDLIWTGTGNDWAGGGTGDDTLWGEAGTDTIYGLPGADFLDGGTGNDCLYGNSGDDIIYGDDGNDCIGGEGDDDTIYGEAGNDTVDGGSGADSILGGTESDVLYGGTENDTLLGGSGADSLYGNNGNDDLQGESEGDRLDGGAGNDSVLGGSGADYLVDYSGGQDTLDGGSENDTICSMDGYSDTIYGGTGDDYCWANDGAPDYLDGGSGTDTLYHDSALDTDLNWEYFP